MFRQLNFVRFLFRNINKIIFLSIAEAVDNKGLVDWYLHMIYLQLQNFHKTKFTKSDVSILSRMLRIEILPLSASFVILQYWLHCPVALLMVWAQIVSYSDHISHALTTPRPGVSFPWFCQNQLLYVTSSFSTHFVGLQLSHR